MKKLPVSGNKATLIDRIEQMGDSSLDPQQPILQLLLDKWFMTPFASSSSMREGTLNEANVLCNVAAFLKENGTFEILEIKEYGLLCSKDVFYAAFSPDGIAVAFHDEFDDVVSLVEIKSKCTTATVQMEMALATRYGVFKSINASTNPLEFKQSIPEASHRCQLVHGMACGDLRHGFLSWRHCLGLFELFT
jgi:hypothetical protein